MRERAEHRQPWRSVGLTAGLGVAAVLLAIQIFPVSRVNPPSLAEISAPPEVASILRRACYDCHSNETRWPWYSRVAPVSWLIAHDVALGRDEINFSEWGTYYPATRRRKLKWMARALRDEKMPPLSYRLMHPAARISEQDRSTLERWIERSLNDSAAGTAEE